MSEYILELRKIVGHRPLIQVGASVIVEDAQGRILLEKRRDNGCWGYCGGSVELDERVEDTACRELFEESGLTAKNAELFRVYSGPDMHYVYPNGDEVSNIDFVFYATDYCGTLTPQIQEVETLEFFSPDHLPEPLNPPNVRAIRDYIAWRKQG